MRNRVKKIGLFILVTIIMILGLTSVLAAADTLPETTRYEGMIPDSANIEGCDVILLLDHSGTISQYEEQVEMRSIAAQTIVDLGLGYDISVGGVYFGQIASEDGDKRLAPVSLESGELSSNLKEFFLPKPWVSDLNDTDISRGLQAGISLMKNLDTERRKVMILFSDGVNDLGNKADTEAADERTRAIASLLNPNSDFNKVAEKVTECNALNADEIGYIKDLRDGSKTIELYCVFLNGGDEDKTNESFLRELVNYEDDSNSYDVERFKMTNLESKDDQSEDDQDLSIVRKNLSDDFAQVFFDMMGNMKSTPLEFDDNGNSTFDIPDLNVDMFNVFLNGDGYEAELSSQDVTEKDWPEVQYHAGNVNPYFHKNNPGKSRWTLHVSGKGAEEASGYLTLYANPIMNFELVPNDDFEELHKGGMMLIEARLIDENGKPKPVLQGAQLTAEINYLSEKQEDMEAQLEFSEDGAKWKSDWFNLSDYSVYNITVHFTYKFLSLDYTLDPMEIIPLPVKAKTLEKETFISKRIDGKEHFEIDKVRLYTGYGNEDIVMEEYKNNGSNTVSVVDNGQKIEVTAEHEGEVLFEILLKDNNNPDIDPVSVTVSGTVNNSWAGSLRWIILLAVLLAVAVIVAIIIVIKRTREKKEAEEEVKKVKEEAKKAEEVAKQAEEEAKKAEEEAKKAEEEAKIAEEKAKKAEKRVEVVQKQVWSDLEAAEQVNQQKLKKKDQELTEKDQELTEKDQKLTEKDQKLTEKDQKLKEKDQELKKKNQELIEAKSNTKMIEGLREDVSKKQGQINELLQYCDEHENRVAGYRQGNAEKYNELSNLPRRVQELTEEIKYPWMLRVCGLEDYSSTVEELDRKLKRADKEMTVAANNFYDATKEKCCRDKAQETPLHTEQALRQQFSDLKEVLEHLNPYKTELSAAEKTYNNVLIDVAAEYDRANAEIVKLKAMSQECLPFDMTIMYENSGNREKGKIHYMNLARMAFRGVMNLNEVTLRPCRSRIRDIICDFDDNYQILYHGGTDSDGNEVMILESPAAFRIQRLDEEEPEKKTYRETLYKGAEYRLTYSTEEGEYGFIIET